MKHKRIGRAIPLDQSGSEDEEEEAEEITKAAKDWL